MSPRCIVAAVAFLIVPFVLAGQLVKLTHSYWPGALICFIATALGFRARTAMIGRERGVEYFSLFGIGSPAVLTALYAFAAVWRG